MHVRSIQHVKETVDDVEFATDMEEPVCEGSEEHNHPEASEANFKWGGLSGQVQSSVVMHS